MGLANHVNPLQNSQNIRIVTTADQWSALATSSPLREQSRKLYGEDTADLWPQNYHLVRSMAFSSTDLFIRLPHAFFSTSWGDNGYAITNEISDRIVHPLARERNTDSRMVPYITSHVKVLCEF